MLCIACQLTVAPLFFSSHVQAVPVAPTILTTAHTQEMRTINGIVRAVTTQPLPGATYAGAGGLPCSWRLSA